MLSAARFAAAAQATAWRTGRRHGSSPLKALAPSGARAFSAAWSWIGNAGGTASVPRFAKIMTTGTFHTASGEAITSRPNPAMPLRRSKDRRGFGCSTTAGCGPAFYGEGVVVSVTGTGGNSGIGRGGGGSRSASTNAMSIAAESDESSMPDFAAVKDGTETYLVAARSLEAGRVVFDRVGGSTSDIRTRHSVQVREGLHMESEGDLKLMNHSCNPSCQLEVVEPAALGTPAYEEDLPYLRVTVREPGLRQLDLLTIDYNAMEIDMSSPFDCLCGADNCRGRVSGFANLKPATQKEYAPSSSSSAKAVDERSRGSPPLTGAVKAWAKRNNRLGAH